MPADSMIRAYLAGRSLAVEAERRRGEEEDRALHQQVLQHQLAEMKLSGKLRARQEAVERAKFYEGTPAEQIPPDLVEGPPETGGAPITDAGGSLVPQRPTPGWDMGTNQPQQIPGEIRRQIPFNPETQNRFKPMTIPGVAGPDIQIRPQTAEQASLRTALAQKILESQKVREVPQGTAVGSEATGYDIPAPKPAEHSTSYKKWQDYRSEGGTLGFDAWDTVQGTRRRTSAGGTEEKPLTKGQRGQAQASKDDEIRRLHETYRWDGKAGQWLARRPSVFQDQPDAMSHDEMRSRMLDIENGYRARIGMDPVPSLEAAGWRNWEAGPGVGTSAKGPASVGAQATTPAAAPVTTTSVKTSAGGTTDSTADSAAAAKTAILTEMTSLRDEYLRTSDPTRKRAIGERLSILMQQMRPLPVK
jgi:hypothetical protein